MTTTCYQVEWGDFEDDTTLEFFYTLEEAQRRVEQLVSDDPSLFVSAYELTVNHGPSTADLMIQMLNDDFVGIELWSNVVLAGNQ